MGDIDSNATSGVEVRGYRRGAASTDGWDQYVIPVRDRVVTYQGRCSTFRITARTTATQNLLTIWNGSATNLVAVNRVLFDTYMTAVKAITAHPQIVRVSRITAAPTNGTAMTKVAIDTAQTSDAAVVVTGDASADGTNSASALTATPAGVLTQEVVSRIVGTLGAVFEPADRMEFFVGATDVILRQNQGLVLHLAAPAAQVATDFFVAVVDWEEYTRP